MRPKMRRREGPTGVNYKNYKRQKNDDETLVDRLNIIRNTNGHRNTKWVRLGKRLCNINMAWG